MRIRTRENIACILTCRNHEVNSQLNNRVSALRHGKHTTEFVASYLIVFPPVFVSFPDFIRNVENIHARKFSDVRYDGADSSLLTFVAPI